MISSFLHSFAQLVHQVTLVHVLTYLLTYKADYEYEVDQVCQIQTDGRTDNYDSMSRAL